VKSRWIMAALWLVSIVACEFTMCVQRKHIEALREEIDAVERVCIANIANESKYEERPK
jgi:hypothetical protein